MTRLESRGDLHQEWQDMNDRPGGEGGGLANNVQRAM